MFTIKELEQLATLLNTITESNSPLALDAALLLGKVQAELSKLYQKERT